jgi:dihydrofolate synthase / folylpolyglutamate synthase
MIRTFNGAVRFLEKYIPASDKKHPGSLGLARMQELVRLLGNPQNLYPTIHVGGTSGKGSTSTIIASILATKYKVGLHTSPHLVKINERITYYATGIKYDIDDDHLIDLVNEVRPRIESMEKGHSGPPSYFEIVTAMAFMYFKKINVDLAVIEVGMGGRYDATNVISPKVAVLTNVGLDHTEILGDSVEKIVEDKVGIIKPGISVVSGVTQPSVIKIVEEKCRQENAKLSLLNRDFRFRITELNNKLTKFDYLGGKTLLNLELLLPGTFQAENASLALRAIEELSNHQVNIEEKNIRKALKSVYIPGRMEIIRKKPLVILDGAHNPDKIRALVTSIRKIFPGKKITAIVAIKNDKNAREMLELLLPICLKIILTQYRVKMDVGEIISYNPEELNRIIMKSDRKIPARIITSPIVALRKTNKSALADDVILVTGSLYLVGLIKKIYG